MLYSKTETEIIPIGTRSDKPDAIVPGTVWLVGAGPGDADLLTVKALRAIQQADVIFFDFLISQEILDLLPEEAEKVCVGKRKNYHSLTQDEINELLLSYARKGKNICRLKGGDAFVFGRGGEEMQFLKQHGIDVELVPGITAGMGCTSYAGIPVTHRGVSQGCTFITAHAEKTLNVDWKNLAGLQHTIVFYMGLSKAKLISESLIGNGMDKSTPVALIENGCRQDQRVIVGDLAELPVLSKRHGVKSPALIVVGETVNLSSELSWFNAQLEPQKISA